MIANDGGDGISLREAITAANTQAGSDSIHFNIAGTGTHAINIGSSLTITGTVTIDATTDDSFAANGNMPAIILDGNNSFSGDGLVLTSTSDGSTIRGLLIRDFSGNGINIAAGSDSNTIAGNYIGSFLSTGLTAGASEQNTLNGIYVEGASNTIGGTGVLDGNVIGGNSTNGVYLNGSGATGNTLSSNLIGLNGTGNTALANNLYGVYVAGGASSNTIGIAGFGNTVSGNTEMGVYVTGATSNNNVIQSNVIGLNSAGTAAVSNGAIGVAIDYNASGTLIGTNSNGINDALEGNVISGNTGTSGSSTGGGIYLYATNTTIAGNIIGLNKAGTSIFGNGRAVAYSGGIVDQSGSTNITIGGTGTYAGNTIAGNIGDGILLAESSGNNVSILGNSIWGNTEHGIDLGPDNGVTSNDGGDGDSGANGLQNFPVITSANSNATGTTLVGTLNSNSSTDYLIQFFASRPSVTASPNGEGERYLGSTTVTTNGSSNASFNLTLNDVWVNSGDRISATATVDLGGSYGSSSEFSVNRTATSTGIVVVDTTSDVKDGTTTSISNLGTSRGTDGRISLREAIEATNATANGGTPDKIVFAIPTALASGVHTITLSYDGPDAGTVPDALPTVTQALIIDGWSEPDFSGTPVIELNGDNAGTLVKGLTLGTGSDGSTIRGLNINRFTGTGIEINDSNNQTIQGNWIGLDNTGTVASANGVNGIYATNSTSILIGGTTVAQRNVVSGNAQQGIFFDNTDNSTISGNYIGTDILGTGDVTGTAANSQQSGIYVDNDSDGNVIGGTTEQARNVISGNNHFGFEVLNSTSQNNLLQGNYIGTTADGLSALGNTDGGAAFWGAGSGNVFGGNTSGAGNVISGNWRGVLIGNGTTGAVVQGNFIGVGADGQTLVANGSMGIRIEGGSTNTLIGTDADATNDANERNVISGNSKGVDVTDSGTTNTTIAGNVIGLAADGTTIVGNTSHGVSVSASAAGTMIGGATSVSRNIISGNDGFGVYFASTSSLSSVLNNFIGTDVAGTTAKANLDGVWVDGSSNNIIGQSGAGNLISGNTYYGVTLDGATATGNKVQANVIGTNAAGTGGVANGAHGVRLTTGANSNTIGGESGGQGNVIAFNAGHGVQVESGNNNAIVRNSIHSNSSLGIDLGVGANNSQSFPVLTGAVTSGTQITIDGTFSSAASTSYRIEFYANNSGDVSGYGEGQTFIGVYDLTTDGTGNASFTAILPANVISGSVISAIASRLDGGDAAVETSAFAQNVIASWTAPL